MKPRSVSWSTSQQQPGETAPSSGETSRFRRAAILAPLVFALFGGTLQVGAIPAPDANSVLILGSTVTGGLASVEATEAVNLGLTPVVVDNATWAGTTAAEFASYRALILGDPTCSGPGTGSVAAAEANRAVWSAEVDGNVIIIGTDEVFHDFQGGRQVSFNGVAFASDIPGKTGLMCSLSCYYHDAAPGTPVPLLDQFGAFTVTGVGCYNDAHIVASHPALAGLTDASLSNWSCSVHEAIDTFPASFLPLVIAENIGGAGSLTFPDGSFGIPYIVARGEGLILISNITLSPLAAENPVGTSHTVTATVVQNDPAPGTPVVGTTVTFTVVLGPNAGATDTDDTDALGEATFTYTSNGSPGIDVIVATFIDAAQVTQSSNPAYKTWVESPNTPPDTSLACPSADCLWPPNNKFVPITIGCVTDPDGDPITIVVTGITSDEPTASIGGAGGAKHSPDGYGIGTDTAHLRAERSGIADGRVYEISFTASDGLESSPGSVRVKVPHDQRDKSCLAVDSGQLFDATQKN